MVSNRTLRNLKLTVDNRLLEDISSLAIPLHRDPGSTRHAEPKPFFTNGLEPALKSPSVGRGSSWEVNGVPELKTVIDSGWQPV